MSIFFYFSCKLFKFSRLRFCLIFRNQFFMATVNLPFESLLTDIGLGQLKSQLDQLIANPADTAEMVFEHLKDQVDSPINLPVVISKPADQYIIEAAEDLIANNQEFFLHELESVLKQFRIKLNDAAT